MKNKHFQYVFFWKRRIKKIFLIMKLTLILSLVLTLNTLGSVYSQNARFSIDIKDKTVREVFQIIEQQSKFRFFYNDEFTYINKDVSLSLKDANVSEILQVLFASSDITYRILNNNLVVLTLKQSLQQKVSGTVIDALTGGPLPGVNIIVEGTNIGVTSDLDGKYSIGVPDGNTVLIFSYIGYLTEKVPVIDQTTIDVKLVPDAKSLDEVVVVGYGKQRKIETLGSQSSIKITELKQPVANMSTVLTGRIAGLVGVQRSGEPGYDGSSLWIRGIVTFDNKYSAPLILVDGVERSFNNLDPSDIESFTILKDASSTSVYGVRGANGVILITTRKGSSGTPKINFDFYQGITKFTRVPETADGLTYMQMANEASVTRGGLPVYSAERIQKTYTQEDPYLYPNVNWFDQIFNDFGSSRKANLNMSGGGDKMSYYVSSGYYNEKGLFKTDDLQQYNSEISFTRYNFTSALTVNPTKTTSIDLGIKGWISNGNYPGTATSSIFSSVFNTYPIVYPVTYADKTKEPWVSTGGGVLNPYFLLTNRGYATEYNNQIYSDIRVKQDLGFWVNGLSAYVLYSFDATNANNLKRAKSPSTYYARNRDANGDLIYEVTKSGSDYLSFSRSSSGSRQFYLESALNYDNSFGKHHVSGLVLYNQNDRISANATDLIGSIPYRSLGLVGRVNYGYNDRYLLEASFGYNGSENFESSKRFGFFPAGAVGWVISNEKFWGNLKKTIQLFKLRASYGLVGNSNIDGRRFAYIATVNTNTGTYYYNKMSKDNGIVGYDIDDYAASVTWETEKDMNLGVEVNTLNDALSVQVDYFTRRRENIFLERASVPSFVGLRNNLLGNLGITSAKGIDLGVTYNKSFGPLSLQLKSTYTYNNSEVIENDEPVPAYPYLERRGEAIGQRFGYIAEGFYAQEEIDDPTVAKTAGVVMAGDLKYKDMNNDGVIDANDQASIGLGAIPQIVYGFGTTIGYKGFSLGAFFQGVAKVDLYMASEFMPFRNSNARGSLYSNITDRWTPESPGNDAFYPRLSYGEINQNFATSSHWLMDGRFLRLKTLDFGYTLPSKALENFGVKKMRIYFIGYNLFTFSPFKLWDPELGDGTGSRYPNIKTYSLGVNVSF